MSALHVGRGGGELRTNGSRISRREGPRIAAWGSSKAEHGVQCKPFNLLRNDGLAVAPE